MGTRWVGVGLVLVLAGCGGGTDTRATDQRVCKAIYRLGSMGGDQADKIAAQVQKIGDGDIEAAAQAYADHPDPDTARALVAACGDPVPSKS